MFNNKNTYFNNQISSLDKELDLLVKKCAEVSLRRMAIFTIQNPDVNNQVSNELKILILEEKNKLSKLIFEAIDDWDIILEEECVLGSDTTMEVLLTLSKRKREVKKRLKTYGVNLTDFSL